MSPDRDDEIRGIVLTGYSNAVPVHKIAKAADCSEDTIWDYLTALRAEGLIDQPVTNWKR